MISFFTRDDINFIDEYYHLKKRANLKCHVCEKLYTEYTSKLRLHNVHYLDGIYYYIPKNHTECVELWKMHPIPHL